MEGQTWADPEIGGINDAFDKLFDPQNESTNQPVTPQEPAKKEDTASATKEEPKVSEPKSEQKKMVKIDEIKIEDGFFSEEEEEEKKALVESKDGFDEEAFDKETEEATKGMEAKAGEKFKALRNELKEAKQKTITPDIQQKLNELELKAAEADGLRQRMEELSNQSAKIRVETSDEYVKQVKKPVSDLFAKAEEMAKSYEGDVDLLWSIVTERDRRKQNEMIKEHLGEFSDFDRSEVFGMSRDFNKYLGVREEMLSDAETHIQKIEADRIAQTEKALQDHKRMVQTYQREIWSKYRDVIPGFVDENGRETAQFKSLMNRAMSLDFSKAKPRDQAFAAFSGVVLKHMAEQMNEYRMRLAEYESGDERDVKARPNTGDSVSSSKASRPSSEGKSFVESFAEADLI